MHALTSTPQATGIFSRVRIGVVVSILSVALGVTSVISIATISFSIGERALMDQAGISLARARQHRTTELQRYLAGIDQDLVLQSRNPFVVGALKDLTTAFAQLGSDAGNSVQTSYGTGSKYPPGQRQKLVDANDRTGYSSTHAKYFPYFRSLFEQRGYYDVFLIDTAGNVVLTVVKEPDFGSSLRTGAWRATGLARAFLASAENPVADRISFSDFERYEPSNFDPAAFIATPIFFNDIWIGPIAFQMPMGRINNIMQQIDGHTKTDEQFIVGGDNLMRSDARLADKPTILTEFVAGLHIESALKGRDVEGMATNARGIDVLGSYGPMQFHGVTWVVGAEIAVSEIRQPIMKMLNYSLIAVLAFVILTAAAGILIGRSVQAPIAAIIGAMRGLTRKVAGPDSPKFRYANEMDEIASAAADYDMYVRLVEAQNAKSLGNLAGGVAHDFNNIIAAIGSFAALMIHDADEYAANRRYAQRIIGICARAAELVQQILLFSRASHTERVPYRIGEPLEELKSYLRVSTPVNIELNVILPPPEITVLGNSGQLLQALMNMGVNSRQAIGDRPGNIECNCSSVRLSRADLGRYNPGISTATTNRTDGVVIQQFVSGMPVAAQDYVCITVRDNGPGVSQPTLERMFEPFFSTKKKVKGTGLGMAVVASVVAAHDGFTTVTSAPGHGCRVRLFLPLTTQVAVQEPEKDIEQLNVSGTERVLIVDDDADLAEATALMLAKYGYETTALDSPLEALRLFSNDPNAWDVVITDQVMPEMRGLVLIKQIKAIRPDISVILCTGFSDTANEATALTAGAGAFFKKPLDVRSLAQAIRRLCKPVTQASRA
ncbi:MAG: response regulator [Rhodospirillaceae bacterium]|nr:response regulator [Rhodospirillaceae bacterium]